MTTQQFLVIHMTDSTGSTLEQDEDQRMLESWAQEGTDAGVLGPGAPVAGRDQAKSVSVRDGRTIITDGPFPESKELLAGYWMVDTTLERALEIAAKASAAPGPDGVPIGQPIEVRELMSAPASTDL